MRESEFWRMVAEEFGSAHGGVLATSLTLEAVGYRTASEALADGVPVRDVWIALCKQMDVPRDRWLGRDIPISDHPSD